MEQQSDYPIAFITKGGNLFPKSKIEVSDDGSPRYIVNPNSDKTYSFKTLLLSDYESIFEGDKMFYCSFCDRYFKTRYEHFTAHLSSEPVKIIID